MTFKRIISIIIGGIYFISLSAQVTIGTPGQIEWEYWRELPDDKFEELFARETYPDNPDGTQILYSLKSPSNFDNLYGSRMTGFIRIDQTENVQFNITGDNRTELFISTDHTKENLDLVASIDGHTGSNEHDKYESQTTSMISFSGGQYYYFELIHVEGGGGDHSAVWWKTSFTGTSDWNYITSDYLYQAIDNSLPSCPSRGTSCDDNNSATIDDKEDGYCNCMGSPIVDNPCIGERQEINWYQYENIPGGSLNDLLTNENFPGMPNTSTNLEFLGIYSQSRLDSIGSLIEGYIVVPQTGSYEFNLTGNSRARFFLSSDDNPDNKTAHQILNINTVGATDHDNDLSQNMKVDLEKDRYYYFELTHKESTGSEHFGIFWKTPFANNNDWKRIPTFYLYDYNCELACINDGTPCDDGNPYTNDDQYSNCECTGTPCESTDCDNPLASYDYYPDCGITDQLDNRSDASWLSCALTTSPHSSRGTGHWIMYDFGEIYQLYNTQIWNYNAAGATENGFNQVVIDLSNDGLTWTQYGDIYTWELADGSSEYSGFQGPNFEGLGARFVLITSIDDPNTSGCRGIGKILFNAEACPSEGSSCNDGDSFTAGDIIIDCQCQGVLSIVNDCDVDTLNLGSNSLATDNYSAIQKVISSNTIKENNLVSFVSGKSIELDYDFEVMEGANFVAQILDCGEISAQNQINKILKSKTGVYLSISQPENGNEIIIDYLIPYAGFAQLRIMDSEQNNVRTLFSDKLLNPGFYRKIIKSTKLIPGEYSIELLTTKDGATQLLQI